MYISGWHTWGRRDSAKDMTLKGKPSKYKYQVSLYSFMPSMAGPGKVRINICAQYSNILNIFVTQVNKFVCICGQKWPIFLSKSSTTVPLVLKWFFRFAEEICWYMGSDGADQIHWVASKRGRCTSQKSKILYRQQISDTRSLAGGLIGQLLLRALYLWHWARVTQAKMTTTSYSDQWQ